MADTAAERTAAEIAAVQSKIEELEKKAQAASGEKELLLMKQLVPLREEKVLLMKQQAGAAAAAGAGAAAGGGASPAHTAGAGAAAVIHMRPEYVHLIIDGSGAPLTVDTALINGRVNLNTIKDFLASNKLSLATIDGRLPDADSDGNSLEQYTPGATLKIQANLKPDDVYKEADLREKGRQRRWIAVQAILAMLVAAAAGVLVAYLGGLWKCACPTSPGSVSPGSNTISSNMSSRAADTGGNP